MPFRAIIFDLDGTLMDTLRDIANAMNRVLARNGLPTHGPDAYRRFTGDGAAALVCRALPEHMRDDQTVREYLDAYRSEYSRCWNIETKPYEGVLELIEALKSRGMRMAVLSNKPHDFTMQCVLGFFPNGSFLVTLGQREGTPRKPHPAGALEAASMLGAEPRETIFLGDSEVDMETALTAGMFPVGALWGFRSRRELLESGAKALIEKPMDLIRLLDTHGASR